MDCYTQARSILGCVEEIIYEILVNELILKYFSLRLCLIHRNNWTFVETDKASSRKLISTLFILTHFLHSGDLEEAQIFYPKIKFLSLFTLKSSQFSRITWMVSYPIAYLRLLFCDGEHKGFKNEKFVSQFY